MPCADAAAGCEAIAALFAAGVQAAAIELVDGGALRAARAAFPVPAALPDGAGFLVVVELDGAPAEVQRLVGEVREAVAPAAMDPYAATGAAELEALARWRDGVSWAVTGVLGAKLSEDVVVPVDRIAGLLAAAEAIGGRHGLPVCTWGHAGDGNLHVSFLLHPGSDDAHGRARLAGGELHAEAVALGGSISGEHGIGHVKRDELGLALGPAGLRVHRAIKDALDPKGLFNPGKKG
ncbi:FAD-linked oxidase C-terminal domain-containing protein [Baekduia soli]|uniref:FAD-linked oxidase C-terminal domain-containing protein n=1 Tax=Baekduia soli TaxID=496014 RepID=UPI00225DE887|nr:FAD-linked oxidase C-terminal domain-containing protein [Baekduia soli]